MDAAELARVRAEATEIAEAAGALLMAGFRSRPRTSEKRGFSDLVTEFDVKSEALVKASSRQVWYDVSRNSKAPVPQNVREVLLAENQKG